MKRVIMTATFLLAGIFLYQTFAQSTEDDIQIIQGAWGKEKRELVRQAMGLSAADSVKFWPVYDQYEVARKKIGKERLQILDDYTNSYETLTNTKADELVGKLFKNEAANAQLMQQYYGSMKKALNSLEAAKFLHVESFLQSYVKAQIQGHLPFIGALEKMKQN